MKKENFTKIFSAGLFALILSAAPLAAAEDSVQEKGQAPMMDEAMMAKWKEYSTPNENHQVLGQFVGSWNYSLKWWMTPDGTPEESVGVSEAKWIMDGRFIEQNVQGQSMGQPFEGKQTIGYDNAKKEYIATWFDNMGTGMMIANGEYDPAAQTFTQSGIMMCPFKGKMPFRWVTKIIDADTYTFETYSADDKGQEFRNMEIVYKRNK